MNKIKQNNSKADLADDVKHAYDTVSPFIEKRPLPDVFSTKQDVPLSDGRDLTAVLYSSAIRF